MLGDFFRKIWILVNFKHFHSFFRIVVEHQTQSWLKIVWHIFVWTYRFKRKLLIFKFSQHFFIVKDMAADNHIQKNRSQVPYNDSAWIQICLTVIFILLWSLVLGVNHKLIVNTIVLICKNCSPEFPLPFMKGKMLRAYVAMNEIFHGKWINGLEKLGKYLKRLLLTYGLIRLYVIVESLLVMGLGKYINFLVFFVLNWKKRVWKGFGRSACEDVLIEKNWDFEIVRFDSRPVEDLVDPVDSIDRPL